ncbi:MAG: Uma2 family endonuclease [Pyrinomonadaceae bacterium]
MSLQLKQRYSLKEYFALELESEEKYEYFNGDVFCMSGVSPNHSLIEGNLNLALRLALRKRNCLVFTSNLRIKVPAAPPYRYPDLTVLCDKPVYEEIGGIDALINPTLMIEVLSSSTEAFDRGDKFTYYKSIPGFREYLLIAQHRPHITHYVKQSSGKWEYEETNDPTADLYLPSVDCTLSLNEVYLDVEFGTDVQ